ncbi:MAG: pyridoxal-dependent decarboxylase, partial [Solirubrobacteraceae bacterium]
MSDGAARGLGTGDLEEFGRAGHTLVDAVAEHLAALPERPVWQPMPDGLRAELLSMPLPEGPSELARLTEVMTRDVLPYAMGNGHPGFFGWVNPPPSLAGVLASLTAAAMNPSVGSGDHADVHLERTVVRWLAELVGYPHAPGAGLLTSGASAATIVCLAGARSRAMAAAGRDVRRDGLHGGPPLLHYVPAETHSCVPRAIELLGIGSASIRPVPIADGRLDAGALRAAIAA